MLPIAPHAKYPHHPWDPLLYSFVVFGWLWHGKTLCFYLCSQSTRDLWFQMISSLMRRSFISLQTTCISSAVSCSMLRGSSCWRQFCFCFRILYTLRKLLWFQHCNWRWHLSSLSWQGQEESFVYGSQANLMISLHFSSLVHIALNKNCFFLCL